MKAIIAKAKVQEGKEAEFEKVALELAAQVEANEPGNTLYKRNLERLLTVKRIQQPHQCRFLEAAVAARCRRWQAIRANQL